MRIITAFLPLTMPMLLAACLGGGGGGGGGTSGGQSGPLTLDSTPTAFTSFDDLGPNSLVEASAASSVNYAAGVLGNNVQRDGDLSFEGSALRVLTGDVIDPDDADSGLELGGLRLTVNLEGDATIVRDFMEDPTEVGTGLTADRFGQVEIENADNEVTDRLLLEIGPLNYMTFGLWELGIGQESIDIGGAAWGALTATTGANSMPTGGSATYQGDLIGYNILGGSTEVYVATATLAASFDAATVTLSSTGTTALDGSGPFAGLDIAPSEGTFSGSGFSGAELNLQGAATFEGRFGGSFYGPDAAEAGGWFETRNSSPGGNENDRYFGSFGGARGAIVNP